MDKFKHAFEYFKATGCFRLTNAPLTFLQLCEIQGYIETKFASTANLNPFEEPISDYQFHLSRVELIPDDVEQVLIGAINEHTIVYNDNLPDVHIVGLGTKPREHISLRITEEESNLIRQQSAFEKALLNLLCQKNIWHTIKLDRVMFSSREGRHAPLNEDFFSELLEGLTHHTDTLKDFGLMLPSYIEQSKFIKFLHASSNLETLHLELGYSYRGFLQALCQTIVGHPSLKFLDLGTMELDAAAYRVLSKLLDENYRIELNLSEPVNRALFKQHDELIQRLTKSGLERFREEHMGQHTLVDIAARALEEGDRERFTALLRPESELAAITYDARVEQVCQKLPTVYGTHTDYVKHYASDFQLDLHKPLEEGKSKTVGYYLLEKAFVLEDGESIVRLLRAGANLLERTEKGNTLLSPLSVAFEDKECPGWKKTIANYFQKDLSVLIPAARYLSQFESVYSPLDKIKQHLDRYLTKLRERAGWPSFLQLISGVSFRLQARKREWKRAFETLADTIDAGTERGAEIDYDAMDAFHQWVKRLRADVDLARRGWLGRSDLNDGLKHLGTELENEVDKCLKVLHVKEVAESAEKGAEEQADRVRELEEKRSLDKARHAKDKEEMEAKLKEQEEKINKLSQWMESNFVFAAYNQSKETISEEKSIQEENKHEKHSACFKF